MTDNSDFFSNLGGSGAPTARLSGLGDFVYGEIVDSFKKDYVPFGKTDPEKRSDGTIRQQLVVILQTDQRNWAGVNKVPRVDANDPNSAEKAPSEDDGKRAVYVPEGSNIQYAIGRAVQAAGDGVKFAAGGTLGVKVANLKDTGKGNPLKEHEAVYKPATAGADLFNQTAPAPAPQAPTAPAPAAQPVTPPAAPAAPAPAPAAPVAPAPAPQVDPWTGQAAAPTVAPPF